MQKIYNPSSFAGQLPLQHRIWVQAVHKALTDIMTQLKITQTSSLDHIEPEAPHDNVSAVSSDPGSSDGQKRP